MAVFFVGYMYLTERRFCAYSDDKDALADFILRFKEACEDKILILDLFSRAELD